MPTYVYKNLETGELYELKQSMKDAPYRQHPETGAPVKRLISPPAIAFRGSGFYVTDSRSPGSTAGSSSDSGTSAAGGSSAGSSTGKGSDKG